MASQNIGSRVRIGLIPAFIRYDPFWVHRGYAPPCISWFLTYIGVNATRNCSLVRTFNYQVLNTYAAATSAMLAVWYRSSPTTHSGTHDLFALYTPIFLTAYTVNGGTDMAYARTRFRKLNYTTSKTHVVPPSVLIACGLVYPSSYPDTCTTAISCLVVSVRRCACKRRKRLVKYRISVEFPHVSM